MKKSVLAVKLLSSMIVLLMASCESGLDLPEQEISQEQLVSSKIIEKLKKAGFYTDHGLYKFEDGYIIESDIFLTEGQIDELIVVQEPGAKHYRTHQLVNVPPRRSRTLDVYFDPDFSSHMQNSFKIALRRYNDLYLGLNFKKVNNRNVNDIRILAGTLPTRVLGRSAGFPTSGNPARTITLNQDILNSVNRADAPLIIAHEIGHAIGFRHTDYKNRSFSCGGPPRNEGTGTAGANHIPGTPTGPDTNSWMLACGNGNDRPFTANDQKALRVLYPTIFGEFRTGTQAEPTLGLPSSYWYYAIRHKVNNRGEFVQPDGIIYLKGAEIGNVEVITADNRIPQGWVVIDQFKEYNEYGEPEEDKRYQYLVIQYNG